MYGKNLLDISALIRFAVTYHHCDASSSHLARTLFLLKNLIDVLAFIFVDPPELF